MKTIKSGSRGTEAKIVQALLNLHLTTRGQVNQKVLNNEEYKNQLKLRKCSFLPLTVDGSFGANSVAALKTFQALMGLVVDGKAGPATQRAMWIMPAANSKIVTIQFPLKNLVAQHVINHSCDASSTLNRCMKEGNGTVGSNAGMFNNTNKGTYPYGLLNDTLAHGEYIPIKANSSANVGGNYLPEGLALCNSRKIGSVYFSTTNKSLHKAVDFVGCNELLIENYQKVMKTTPNLGSGFMKQKTAWIAWGVDDEYLYYMTNLSNTPLNDLGVEGVAQHIKYLCSYDGGGSRCLQIAGANVFSTSRVIPQCFVFDIAGLFA